MTNEINKAVINSRLFFSFSVITLIYIPHRFFSPYQILLYFHQTYLSVLSFAERILICWVRAPWIRTALCDNNILHLMSHCSSCPAFGACDAGNLLSWCNCGLICPTSGSPSSSKAVAVELVIPSAVSPPPSVRWLPSLSFLARRNSQWYLKVKHKGALMCCIYVLFLFLQVVYNNSVLFGKHGGIFWDAAPRLSLLPLY